MLDISVLLFFLGGASFLTLLARAIIASVRRQAMPRRRWIALSFAVAACGVAGVMASPTPSQNKAPQIAKHSPIALPAYLVLRTGQKAYLDSNDEGNGMKGTLFHDWSVVEKWYSGNFETPAQLTHIDLPVGTEIVVDDWRIVGSGKGAKTMVRVHTTRDPRQSGYALDIDLLPLPPPGAPVIISGMFKDKQGNGSGAPMYRARNSPAKQYINVMIGSRGVILDVDQHPDADTPYHVRLTDGPQRHLSGYFARYTVAAPSNGAGGEEYNAWCKCVTMFLNTHV